MTRDIKSAVAVKDDISLPTAGIIEEKDRPTPSAVRSAFRG